MTKNRILLIITLIAVVSVFFAFDLGQYLTLEYFKSQQAAIEHYRLAHPVIAAAGFFVIYIAVTGLSLPGAALMTLAAGAIFGLTEGALIVSFASTIGATLAFLVSRLLLRDLIQQRFGDKLQAANRGVEKDGAFYLFTLRLVPAFPFFVINLIMGLTPIRAWTFYWVSQVGMLAGTLVYVNAGTQLARVESLAGILSPGLIVSFTLLGIFPLLTRKAVELFKTRRSPHHHPKPKRFDRDLVVIGAGSGGLVSAYIGSTVKAQVSLIEKHRMGGDCLNTGCVPSKALIRSARFLSHARRARELGFNSASVDFDFAHVMERVQRVIRQVEPHDSVDRYTRLGVDCIQGEAQITSPYTVEVNGRTLTTRNIIVATGGRPAVPPIPGIETTGYRTSDNIWDLRTLPGRLLVIGGGPIGCELAQCFARFGSHVIQLGRSSRLLKNEDPEFSTMVMERFDSEGVELRMAIADEEAHGLVKVLTVPDKDRILGVTIAGEHAGELIAEFVTAMRHGLGLNKILGTIHIYPTLTEANKYVAGNWKRAHAPEKVLAWLERYHRWRRGGEPLRFPQPLTPSQQQAPD